MNRRLIAKSSPNGNIVSTSSTGWPKWKQSPINLNRAYVYPRKFPPLLLSGHWLNEGSAIMVNTGETVQIELQNREVPRINGGPLEDDYQLQNLQFRWGENNCHGAEHALDNTWYAMEAQLIHWNSRYGSYEKCYDKSDGIAIISYLFLVSGCPGIADNPEFTTITDSLPKIREVGRTVHISPDCLKWMIDCFSSPGYYTYHGSLTTPPYYECVTWIVILNPIRISFHQMGKFREICDHKSIPILRNYRSQQSLHRRRIFYADEKSVD